MTDKTVVMKVMQLPVEYGDAADLFLKAENASYLWEKAVAEAKIAMSWRIDHLSDHHDLKGAAGKIDASREMLDSLLRCSPIERSVYVRELAAKLDVAEPDLRAQLNEQFGELKEVELRPEPKPQTIKLDKYKEAVAFPCPDCGEHRTHYALKTMHCWNCDEWRVVPSVKALQRQVNDGWERRVEAKADFEPEDEKNGLIDMSQV